MRMLIQFWCLNETDWLMHRSDFISCVKSLELREACVAKLVPNRIFSVAVYPEEDRVLAAAGGKWGELGLWDLVGDPEHH